MEPLTDHRTEKVKAICDLFIDIGCSDSCVLAEACKSKAFDSKEIYDARINKAADDLKK